MKVGGGWLHKIEVDVGRKVDWKVNAPKRLLEEVSEMANDRGEDAGGEGGTNRWLANATIIQGWLGEKRWMCILAADCLSAGTS